MSNLNGAEWKPQSREVRTYGRNWDVVVMLDTGVDVSHSWLIG